MNPHNHERADGRRVREGAIHSPDELISAASPSLRALCAADSFSMTCEDIDVC